MVAVWVLRAVFLVTMSGVGYTVISSPAFQATEFKHPMLVFAGLLVLTGIVIAGDALIPRKKIEVISCVYFGIFVGLFLTYVVGVALEPLMLGPGFESSRLKSAITLVLGVIACYICISLLLQTRDDFRFIIPYVEFSKEVKGLKPLVLDTSIVIDGRIADLAETHVLDTQLIMPRFVLAELQGIADSSDKLRRSRGRRGLDILNKLRNSTNVDLRIYDRELPESAGQPVDMKLVLLAKHLEGKIVTGDVNLNKVARLHNVPVINLNDIANSLKPVFLPGESLEVRIVKTGEEIGQGVGYLDDGTMVVVEQGREHVSKNVRITVTSVLQTSAGRMIFGRYNEPA